MCFLGFVTALCTVDDGPGCDLLSKVVAESFFCDDSSSPSCFSLLAQQMIEISPSGWSLDRYREGIRWFVTKCMFASSIVSLNQECTQLFVASIRLDRQPLSVMQANASLGVVIAEHAILDEACGEAWTVKNCDEEGCPLKNLTCALEEEFAKRTKTHLGLKLFYAMRRERVHLQNMLTACTLTSSPVPCSTFVLARIAEYSKWLEENE